MTKFGGMPMKTNAKHIYFRTKQMLVQPAVAWTETWKEHITAKAVFRNYLFPIATVLSVIVFLLRLIHYDFWQALGLGSIHWAVVTGGAWCTYWIAREYLCNKLNYSNSDALKLTVYSYAIFILFHSVGGALENTFIGQLFTLFSFIFLRTLYFGTGHLRQLPGNHKTNILIIIFLSSVCFPIIITQVLRMIFRISAIHI